MTMFRKDLGVHYNRQPGREVRDGSVDQVLGTSRLPYSTS